MKAFQKIVLLLLFVSSLEASVLFSPQTSTCAPAGCSPLTITNNTGKPILFAGIDMTYTNPKVPLSNFNYVYSGCTNGYIGSGASCEVTINPNGFTINSGTYPVRPRFFRTASNPGSIQELSGISFYFDPTLTAANCMTDSTCTNDPDNICKQSEAPTGGQADQYTCVECVSDDDCSGNDSCKLTNNGVEGTAETNTCVVCLQDNAASTTPDTGCPGTASEDPIKCLADNSGCVECIVNADCLGGEECNDGICVIAP